MGNPEAGQAADIDPLVIETAALRASNQIKELLCLGGGGEGRVWERGQFSQYNLVRCDGFSEGSAPATTYSKAQFS